MQSVQDVRGGAIANPAPNYLIVPQTVETQNNGYADPPRLALRPAECSRAIGISARKLWELTADKTSGIPHVRLGKAILYPVRELQDWLAEQSRKGGRS